MSANMPAPYGELPSFKAEIDAHQVRGTITVTPLGGGAIMVDTGNKEYSWDSGPAVQVRGRPVHFTGQWKLFNGRWATFFFVPGEGWVGSRMYAHKNNSHENATDAQKKAIEGAVGEFLKQWAPNHEVHMVRVEFQRSLEALERASESVDKAMSAWLNAMNHYEKVIEEKREWERTYQNLLTK